MFKGPIYKERKQQKTNRNNQTDLKRNEPHIQKIVLSQNVMDILSKKKKTKQICPSSLFPLDILLKVLASAVRPEKTIKGIKD